MTNIPSTLLVVFGISGDLSHRYLLPALCEVEAAGQLPTEFALLGVSRRRLAKKDVFNSPKLKKLTNKISTEILQMDLGEPADYNVLSEKIRNYNAKQVIFYFAVPPAGVLPIVSHLGRAGLNKSHMKLLMEKPFGTDFVSAKKVINEASEHFDENQIYRIDHYLAKEMSQNISVFLGGNILFRDVWSNQYIDNIEVIVAERIGIEARAKFYEQTGALRDVVQNHALQLVALTIAEPCSSVFEFEELPKRRLQALKSLHLTSKEPLRGQYVGYKKETKAMDSSVETFVALEVESDLPKWRGVPIKIITGKNLSAKSTQIQVNFKKTHKAQANHLVIRVQPHEGIELGLWVKEPGYERKLKKEKLEFDYSLHFSRLPDAYEQVLVDAIRSNQHLFASSGEVLEGWRILQPVLDEWGKNGNRGLVLYKPGSEVEEVTGGW